MGQVINWHLIFLEESIKDLTFVLDHNKNQFEISFTFNQKGKNNIDFWSRKTILTKQRKT